MQLRPLQGSTRPPQFVNNSAPVRVRSSAIGLFADHLRGRAGLGQIALQGEALVSGELTVHVPGHGTLVLHLMAGESAADAALELASRLLTEASRDASVRPRGNGFAVALGKKLEVV
jgi:hypothetical protein